MAQERHEDSNNGWGWLRQVQSTTQQLGQICTEGVGEAKRRLEENRPGIDQFVKNLGDNMQQGVKKVQEQQPGLDQLVRNIGDNVNKGVRNFQENLARDPWSSPPTASEVASLDVVYVNDRLIAMKLPVDKKSPDPASASAIAAIAIAAMAAEKERGAATVIRPQQDGNDIDVVAALFRSRHAGHYMVWNVSEESYDYSMFEEQVLEFNFPGHPAPPLGMLFKICSSIESWICADDKNVAAVHCLTGRGRTSTVLACYLAWVGEFSTPNEALQQVASSRGIPMERLTIPSQRRYVSYFANVIEGIRPRSEPLLLRRVIMNTIPTFGTKGGSVIGPGKGAAALAEEEAVAAGGEGENGALGCCPYLQLFKGGSLIFTAAYRPCEGLAHAVGSGDGEGQTGGARAATPKDEYPWAYTSDDSVAFLVDCVLQGDLLIRCRHLSPDGRRVSMFRAAFHTGYVPSGVLRLTKQQLDGACADGRFHQDFFLDLIFAPVETSSTSASSPTIRDEGPEASSSASASTSANSEAVQAPSDDDNKDGKDDAAEGPSTTALAAEGQQAVVEEGGQGTTEGGVAGKGENESENSAAARREGGVVVGTEAEGAFDSMLHRDERFWEGIALRKERRAAVIKEREAARAREKRVAAKGQGIGGIATGSGSASRFKAATEAIRAGGIKFSIEDDVSQSDRTEWSKAASSPAPAPTAASAALASTRSKPETGGIDDDDLLAQIAEAERGEGISTPRHTTSTMTNSSSTSGVGSRSVAGKGSDAVLDEDGASVSAAADASQGLRQKEGSRQEEEEGLDIEHEPSSAIGQKSVTSTASSTSEGTGATGGIFTKAVASGGGTGERSRGSDISSTGAVTKPATAASGPSLEDELTQLEELERELGIMGVGKNASSGGKGDVGKSAGKGTGPSTGGASSLVDAEKDDSFDMENLDELEGYLKSLAK